MTYYVMYSVTPLRYAFFFTSFYLMNEVKKPNNVSPQMPGMTSADSRCSEGASRTLAPACGDGGSDRLRPPPSGARVLEAPLGANGGPPSGGPHWPTLASTTGA